MSSPEEINSVLPATPQASNASFETKKERLHLTPATAAQMVADELEREKPDQFGPKWIKNKLPNVYAYFTRCMRAGSMSDWTDLTSQLPENWSVIWSKETSEKWDQAKAKSRLLALLEKEKPEQFNKRWVFDHDQRLYTYLNTLSNKKETMHIWRDLTASIGKWKDIWKDGILDANHLRRSEGNRKHTIESITEDLLNLLEKEKPKRWSPTYIAKTDRHIFRFVERHLVDKKGSLQWDKLVSRLPPEYQKTWTRKQYLDDLDLAEEYSDKEEVAEVMQKNRASLYLFYEATGKDEEGALNEVCSDFVYLIRKGNKEATAMFMLYLQPTISKWLESKALSVSLAQDPEEVKRCTERCFYLWKKDRSFLGYLFRSLQLAARGMKTYQEISLDEDRPGETRNRHETISGGYEPTDEFDDEI